MTVITAAGILPKSMYQGTEYYYFGAIKRTGELSTFCGSLDKNESVKKGAIREFMEESLGAITKKEKIKKIIDKFKNVVRIDNPRVKQTTFIASVKIKENPIKKFAKKRMKPGLTHVQKEMQEIVAIKTTDLVKALQTNNRIYKGHLFRGDAWGTLKIAHQNNLL